VAPNERAAITRAFGSENRERLLNTYLSRSEAVTPANAWLRIYELLLWIDRTTGLGHCYESDKCQPGRPWYARSLAFHDWVAREFNVAPSELGGAVDWLFRSATADVAQRTRDERDAAAARQRAPYQGRGIPLPGEDPELIQIVRDVLSTHLTGEPTETEWQFLTERIHTHIGQENKRKNLLGEGFEDALAALIRRIPTTRPVHVANRVLLGDIPGFHPQGDAEKQKRADLALWSDDGATRLLVTSKWSVRADREEQFGTDFDAYVRVNAGLPFDYVLVTNEFDAARLKNACERVSGNAYLFTQVVHVNPAGVLAAYGPNRRGAATQLDDLIETGRLTSLESWLAATLA
jgi:hypothetical protein